MGFNDKSAAFTRYLGLEKAIEKDDKAGILSGAKAIAGELRKATKFHRLWLYDRPDVYFGDVRQLRTALELISDWYVVILPLDGDNIENYIVSSLWRDAEDLTYVMQSIQLYTETSNDAQFEEDVEEQRPLFRELVTRLNHAQELNVKGASLAERSALLNGKFRYYDPMGILKIHE